LGWIWLKNLFCRDWPICGLNEDIQKYPLIFFAFKFGVNKIVSKNDLIRLISI